MRACSDRSSEASMASLAHLTDLLLAGAEQVGSFQGSSIRRPAIVANSHGKPRTHHPTKGSGIWTAGRANIRVRFPVNPRNSSKAELASSPVQSQHCGLIRVQPPVGGFER